MEEYQKPLENIKPLEKIKTQKTLDLFLSQFYIYNNNI